MKVIATRLTALILGTGLMMAALAVGREVNQAETAKTEKQASAAPAAPAVDPPKDAPDGYTLASNGYVKQADFNKFRDTFSEVENIAANGLGPVYNSTSCVGCHQNPIAGAASQNAELRAGHFDDGDVAIRRAVPQQAIQRAFQQPVGDESVRTRHRDAEPRVLLDGQMAFNDFGHGFLDRFKIFKNAF